MLRKCSRSETIPAQGQVTFVADDLSEGLHSSLEVNESTQNKIA